MMNDEDVLALLVAQAAREGGDLVTLRAIVEESCQLGAQRMLARIGVEDDGAPDDLHKLRELLRAWRDAKASAWRAAVEWAVRGVLALLLIGIAYRMGVAELLR
jgi:hypothetical protein